MRKLRPIMDRYGQHYYMCPRYGQTMYEENISPNRKCPATKLSGKQRCQEGCYYVPYKPEDVQDENEYYHGRDPSHFFISELKEDKTEWEKEREKRLRRAEKKYKPKQMTAGKKAVAVKKRNYEKWGKGILDRGVGMI